MAKYLKLFNTEEEYTEFAVSCDYITPNVSKININGNLYYNKDIKIGDYLFADGTTAHCLQGGKMPVAICVIDAEEMEDKCYRFISVKIQARRRFDPIVIPHDTSKVYTYYDSPLPNYTGVPTLNPETGEFDKFKTNGYTTWPDVDSYYRPERYSVEINGYKYPSPEGIAESHAPGLGDSRGYAPPAFNLDGTRNELYWQKEFNGKLNLFMDFDGVRRNIRHTDIKSPFIRRGAVVMQRNVAVCQVVGHNCPCDIVQLNIVILSYHENVIAVFQKFVLKRKC